MKKLLLLAALAGTTAAYAQRTVESAQPYGHVPQIGTELRTPSDTLVPPSILLNAQELTTYTSQGGGFVVGANAYGDLAKVQVFNNSGSTFVEEVLFLFAAPEGDMSATFSANVYSLDGPGVSTAGDVNNAPNNILGSATLSVGDTDADGLVSVQFSPAVSVDGDFGVGIEFSELPGGTYVGLASTQDGAAGTQPDQTWEQWDSGEWWTMSESWPLSFDMAVLVVIGDGVAGIHDAGAVNNVRLSILGGNPASQNVTIAYEMLEASNTRLTIIDSKGAIVLNEQLGQVGAGLYQRELDVTDFSNGTYYVTVYANGMPMTKRMVVSH